ncbi:hypothetical protein A2U01_0048892, partial [Trifolium medium]|nr:hypothetical protein [Trifolium medium]
GAPAIDPTLRSWFYHTWDQNTYNHRAMIAMQESMYNMQLNHQVMSPADFQAHLAWPGDRTQFGEGADTSSGVDVDDDADAAAAAAFIDEDEEATQSGDDDEMHDD